MSELMTPWLFLAHANKQARKKERKKENRSNVDLAKRNQTKNPYQKKEKETRRENSIQARSKLVIV